MSYKRILLLIFLISLPNDVVTHQKSITLFCHGIIDNHTQIARYHELTHDTEQSFDFADAQTPDRWDLNTLIFYCCSIFGKKVNRQNMAMGQQLDIDALTMQIDTENLYTLYGVSRGGATIINYLAQDNPDNIQAIVLDGTPANMLDALDAIQTTLGCRLLSDSAMKENLFSFVFPAHGIGRTQPEHAIVSIANKELPIFIVHSHQDTIVSIASAYRLYLAFKKANFSHVYLCCLPTGRHSFYMHATSKEIYLSALHSFYAQYNLPYNHDIKLCDLTEFQPSIQEVADWLTTYNLQQELQYQRQRSYNQIGASVLAISFIAYLLRNLYSKQDHTTSLEIE